MSRLLQYLTENTKPEIFNGTIYRIPTEKELQEVHNSNLTVDEIFDGLWYTIVGRGMTFSKQKEQIIRSSMKLKDMFPEESKYDELYKRAQDIKVREIVTEGIPSRQGAGTDYHINPSKEVIKKSLSTSNVLNWIADASNKNVYMWDENKGRHVEMWNKIRHTTGDASRSLYHKDIVAGKYEILTKKKTIMPTVGGLQTNMDGVTSFGWASDWIDTQLVSS